MTVEKCDFDRGKRINMKNLRKRLLKLSLAFVFLPCILAGSTQAQKVDLSTEEAVIEQLGKQKKAEFNKDKICIERLEESTKIIVIGFFSSTSATPSSLRTRSANLRWSASLTLRCR